MARESPCIRLTTGWEPAYPGVHSVKRTETHRSHDDSKATATAHGLSCHTHQADNHLQALVTGGGWGGLGMTLPTSQRGHRNSNDGGDILEVHVKPCSHPKSVIPTPVLQPFPGPSAWAGLPVPTRVPLYGRRQWGANVCTRPRGVVSATSARRTEPTARARRAISVTLQFCVIYWQALRV